MSKQAAVIQELLAEHQEQTSALNPLTGVHRDDVREIFARMALQGVRQPLILGKHLSNHLRKLVIILGDGADYAPAKGDARC